ncbi:MAG: hypothetical protein US49_C0002G0125 [candidate division TM6 bacterium GW2011_GWF2_37_49]|nr:MAG: hypothetical protein US49_C0002G0125 [candidate division TM6 bacterium GW2011_GWF2_37_49]
MLKRNPALYLLDILVSIDRVRRFSVNMASVQDLIKNESACSAVLRELSIIGEAMNHVLRVDSLTRLVKPEWRDVVDFRNILIHEYFGVSFSEIYGIIKNDIPILEQEIISILRHLNSSELLQSAMDCAIDELKQMERIESLVYLNKIKGSL